MGSAERTEQKKMSVYQIAIYIALFLISGYFSYRYLIAPEIKKLQTVRVEYGKQKSLMKEMEAKAQNIDILANNIQQLETELIALRSKVFNEDNDVLTFMRSLYGTTSQTGNKLMSIVPMEAKAINTTTPASDNKNVQAATTPVANTPPATLPCKLKPIEVVFDGEYSNIISFLGELENSGQYMSVSSMTISGGKEKASEVNVKTVLNLVQLGIEARSPNVQVALLQQNKPSQTTTSTTVPVSKTSVQIANQAPVQTNKQVVSSAKPMSNVPLTPVKQTPKTTVASAKPVQPVKQIANSAKPSVNVPLTPVNKTPKATMASTKTVPPTKQVVNVTKPVKNVAVASSAQTKDSEPVLQTKQIEKPVKEMPKSSKNLAKTKVNGANYSVRVGKFDYYENAQKLLNILTSHGYSAWLKTYAFKGKKSYWVYVGTFETKDKAEDFASSMQKELSYIDDYVIMGVKKGIRKNS